MSREVLVTVANLDGLEASVSSVDGRMFDIPQSLLPSEATPGSILRITIEPDSGLELDRRQKIYKLIDDVAIFIRSKTTTSPVPQIPVSGKKSRRGSLDSNFFSYLNSISLQYAQRRYLWLNYIVFRWDLATCHTFFEVPIRLRVIPRRPKELIHSTALPSSTLQGDGNLRVFVCGNTRSN